MLRIQNLIEDAKCYKIVREMRWPTNAKCPHCDSSHITKKGFDEEHSDCQRYLCKGCHRRFDDLTNTIFAGRHQALKVWILCLYFMGLNLSNQQIAQELGLNKGDVQKMTTLLREGIVAKKPAVQLQDEVECDEVYVVAGHKGNPAAVKKRPKRPTQSA